MQHFGVLMILEMLCINLYIKPYLPGPQGVSRRRGVCAGCVHHTYIYWACPWR